LGALVATAMREPRHFGHLVARKVRFLRRYRWVQKAQGATTGVPSPLVLKFLLTYRCNLRCKKCMIWGHTGQCPRPHAQASTEDLDFELLRRVLRDAATLRPSLIFSGGEPLLYPHIADLLSLLRERRLHATFCTNGLLLAGIERELDDNPFVEFLISLDGLSTVNDSLRGAGVYRSVTETIRRLKLRHRPPHLGVQFTMRAENLGTMVEFCASMVDLGVDWVLLNPPWFVTEGEATEYAAVVARQFGTTAHSQAGYQVPFELDPALFVREMARLRARRWPIQISSYFRRPEDMWSYANSSTRTAGNDFCYKQWLRMDVLPSGHVTPCAQFPDVIVGDLQRQSVAEIWNGAEYARFRRHLRAGPLPVCTKCNALYLYDAGRRAL
jgi:radical SAM protein with 4Fe4S-binding SPASM domain